MYFHILRINCIRQSRVGMKFWNKKVDSRITFFFEGRGFKNA